VEHRVVRLDMPASSLSATELRHRLRHGASPDTLVPQMVAPAVASYIARRGLYRP
jgi:nicotinic acid mononucleotide adenylyltransferase